jgi:hypothetical protein
MLSKEGMDEKRPPEPREPSPEVLKLVEAEGWLPAGNPDEPDEPQRPETD